MVRLISITLAALCATPSVASSWAGSNSFFAHALSAADRSALLGGMRDAGQKALRIFISSTGTGDKGSSSQAVDDLEKQAVGSYDDTILTWIDQLMYEASQHGIKLDIAMHDRYALGCWSKDAYVDKYNLPSGYPNCNIKVNQPAAFYTDTGIQEQFDRRLVHILQHKNPLMGNRPWGQISEAILSFAPQNEAQAHMDQRDYGWWCRRAAAMKPYIAEGILVSTGGSEGLQDALQDLLYACPALDVIDVHTYSTSADEIRSNVQQAVSKAKQNGKRIRVQEFGVQGEDGAKAATLDGLMGVLNEVGVPFLPWELVHPQTSDYEFSLGSQTWTKIAERSRDALQVGGAFAWPEVPSGGGSKKPDWAFCATNDECSDGCCSKQYSDDGKYKCTPGGDPSGCTGPPTPKKPDWDFCSSTAECADGCCSKHYSDDGKYKCTPGGSPDQCLKPLEMVLLV